MYGFWLLYILACNINSGWFTIKYEQGITRAISNSYLNQNRQFQPWVIRSFRMHSYGRKSRSQLQKVELYLIPWTYEYPMEDVNCQLGRSDATSGGGCRVWWSVVLNCGRRLCLTYHIYVLLLFGYKAHESLI